MRILLRLLLETFLGFFFDLSKLVVLFLAPVGSDLGCLRGRMCSFSAPWVGPEG